ncbi:MAG: hypothetical protein HND48_24195 [Chloroflexi bacterium]|nr:hypothetical protein [Chloroflexota bacterium]
MRLSRFDLTILIAALVIIGLIALSVLLLRPPDQPLRVAYLAPASSGPQNVWTVIPGDPDSAAQVTRSPGGVFDYAASPDGRRIAYAERDVTTGRVNLMLVDLYDGTTRTLVDCVALNADCTTPAWKPDGSALAYMRRTYDPAFGTGSGVPKIFIIDGLNTGQPRDYPLFNDNQTTGSQPVWSANGRRLAFYESTAGGVLVFDFNPADEADRIKFVPADNGMTGALSPDGETLITSTLEMGGEITVRSQLIVAELVDNTLRDLFPDGQSNDGVSAAWHPDGRRIAVLRQYADDERGTRGQQVYLYDLVSESLTPLIVDDTFNHGALSFSPDGSMLVVQRFDYGGGQPGIWVYEMATGALYEVASNAYLPGWVPASAGG